MYNRHPAHSAKKRTEPFSPWERLQLLRLLCALALFLTVFLGKQIYPEKVLAVGGEVVSVLSTTTDLEAVFGDLGASLTSADGALKGIEDFCVEVFGAQPQESQAEVPAAIQPKLPEHSAGLLTHETQRTALFSQLLPETQPNETAQESEAIHEEEAVPAVGTVLMVGETPADALPEGYTVDQLSFGALESVTPVLGYLNSGFGYRDHPVNGKYLFHGGVDISANAGDPIAAFADGTVEYIGEDESYGLYFQLDHGNGIKSFYAHCQTLCVKKGQQVTAGETVALVGATGTATGPHLHLELRCGDLRVDPAYYVEFLTPA